MTPSDEITIITHNTQPLIVISIALLLNTMFSSPCITAIAHYQRR